MPYLAGVFKGFQERRDKERERNLRIDEGRRQTEGKLFEYLLNSDDPEMKALALTGLFESASPKADKGLQGYLGKLQSGKIYPAVRARMDELIPDTGTGGGPGPPQPGGAAMSANQPVRPGSQPIETYPFGSTQGMQAAKPQPAQPPAAAGPVGDPAMAEIPGTSEELGFGTQPPVGPPPEPPVSKWKRRGTMVPTAEEIAERSAYAGITGRYAAVAAQLRSAGASEAEVQEALMAMSGSPRSRALTQVSQWGVKIPGSDVVQPVLLDQQRGYVLAGGADLPAGAQMVRMGGAGQGLRQVRRQVFGAEAQAAGVGNGDWI